MPTARGRDGHSSHENESTLDQVGVSERVWECESVGVWECGSVGVWECGSVGEWESRRVGVSTFKT